MYSRQANLSTPLNIDVAKIATYLPEFRYRGPIAADGYFHTAITSEYIMNDADHDKFQVLFFDDKTEKGFTTITSSYPPKELSFLFSKLPADLSKMLIEALKGTELAIPTLSETERKEITASYEAQIKREEKLRLVQGPLKQTKSVDFKKDEACMVLQHEYTKTTADSTQPVLGTFGAGPCVILALYDSQNKTAVLAHIDALTALSSLPTLFQSLSKEHTVAHLAGGDSSSKTMCIDIIESLNKYNIKIANADIARSFFSAYDAASLAIDARTGNIYSPVDPKQLYQAPDIDIRLEIAAFQFTKTPLREYKNSLVKNDSIEKRILVRDNEIYKIPKKTLHNAMSFFGKLTHNNKKSPQVGEEKDVKTRHSPSLSIDSMD